MRLPSARFDRRQMLGIALALAAAALVMVATRPEPTVDILVARRDLAAGWPVPTEALATRPVRSSDGLVTADRADEGFSLRAPLAAGEPLVASHIVERGTARPPGVMGIDLRLAEGVMGALVPGDVVDVFATGFEDDTAALVASDVPIVGTFTSDEFGAASSIQVLLGVDEQTAPVIASAARAGALHLVRVHR